MLAILLSQISDRLLSALYLQKCKEFKLYVPSPDLLEGDSHLSYTLGGLNDVEEPLVCVLDAEAVPDKDFVRRILRTARRHPDFDVYHVNLAQGPDYPRKLKAAKFFRLVVERGLPAPLSTFVFRTPRLKEKAVFRADSSLDPLPTILAAASLRPVRNVWRQRLEWTAPTTANDPVAEEKQIRQTLDFYRWSETFFGDEDYPLDTGDRLALFAKEVVRLYPSYDPDDLKEIMNGFQAAQGSVRRMRATLALKSALKDRQKQLTMRTEELPSDQ